MTVGDLRAALADPMLEDRCRVVVRYSALTEDRLNRDEADGEVLGFACRIGNCGGLRVFAVESEIVGV